ncbi:MAG: 30S ribosomal protein S2, partial [Neomegalonema sp.]
NHRWPGGALTNWSTVSKSIQTLKKLDEQLATEAQGFTKKERLQLERQREKLQLTLGGIREMGGKPDMLFVIDTNKEDLAIQEANKLKIPVAAVLDTNSNPEGVTYPIPGNDDAARAIALYCDLVARAALDGMSAQLGQAGIDIGEMEEAPVEEALTEEATPEAATETPAEAPAEDAAKDPAKDPADGAEKRTDAA